MRGTIYDRNFNELAVSYQLFSLYVHPAKMYSQDDAAEKLAEITGMKKETVTAKFKQSPRVARLADDLDTDQVAAIEQLGFEGVYCTASEERFYPEHAAAPYILGYTVDGVGLAGVERKYDILLQPGAFQPVDAQEIDFEGATVLGQQRTDLILSLDIELQKAVDKQLNRLLRDQGAAVGMGLLLDPATGRILVFSSQPSYDPNYFWKSGGNDRRNTLYEPRFDPDLVRPLLIRAAAKIRGGEQFAPLLPQTIAAADFGLSVKEYEAVLHETRFLEPISPSLPTGAGMDQALAAGEKNISLMQIGVGLSSLINGGWRIAPTCIDSVYDQQSGQRFKPGKEAVSRSRILSPAMGIAVRRELLTHFAAREKTDMLALSETNRRVEVDGALSRYIQQQLFVGVIPRQKPAMILVMALERNTLDPVPPGKKKEVLQAAGKSLLADLYTRNSQEQVAEYPQGKNRENFDRFLISRRVDYTPARDSIAADSADMPQVVGMSLRKGLQKLNHYNMRISIRGSGRIVAQTPGAGERLGAVGECVLVLESEI